MRKSLLSLILVIFCSGFSFAQTTVSGSVTDFATNEPLAGVSIVVKGKVIGTITDGDGEFNLEIKENPPMTLVFSFVGYVTQEIQVTDANTSGLKVSMQEQTILGQEIVVSASRVEESILESPVSIEKMDILTVQNTPADNYYKGLANLKGVDVTSSSINFQILNTRGFGSTGNTRFVQLTDGMDTQAPALNFPIGNLNGPSELDVESVELIPGASSALYGPNAFNGIVLVNSKNPFEYQGLSAFAKIGVNHVGKEADYENGPSPVWEGVIRYAKSFKNKFAFKLNFAYMQAVDWHGTDATDRNASLTPAGFSFNPGADRLHYMGDEANINIGLLNFAAQNAYAAEGQPNDNTTFQSLRAVFNGNVGPHLQPGTTVQDYLPFIPSHTVSRTPYAEVDLIDYNAKNMKINGGLFYRINDKLELSYLYNGGFGTSIYTGAQRYSLSNFGISQHRVQLRSDNFYVRAYTTIEDSGGSYITEFLGIKINDGWSSNNAWFATYTSNYLAYLTGTNLSGGETGAGLTPAELNAMNAAQLTAVQEEAHMYARTRADQNRYQVGSATFETTKKNFKNGATIPIGPRFDDATLMHHAEGQYDFKNQIDFMELQVGGSYRLFDLNSNGTIFDDKVQNVTIEEYGGYVQAGKWLGDRKFKLSGSVRYDKNQNFKGRVNPRISGVFKAGQNHNIRLSYQTGFRIPSTQGQHIDLDILSARLIGGLPRYAEKYDIIRSSQSGQNLSFEGTSVQLYSEKVYADGAKTSDIFNPSNLGILMPFTWKPVKPERVQSIEFGYKGLINNNLLIDMAYYYNIYNDFITQVRVRLAEEFTADQSLDETGDPYGYTYNPSAPAGSVNYASLLNGNSGNTYQIYTNFEEQITAQGAVLGLTYNFIKGYNASFNYNWNTINDTPSDFFTEFNTPEHKFNIQFGNRKVTENFGFNVTWRWQDEFEWQSSFTIPDNGLVPAYSTVDAQVSYRIPSIKSVVKLGGSNILNKKYIQSLGGPNIGALYYVSLTFDQLFR
jgi:outer membrane receptor protein involved in Fe transport